MLAPKLRHEQRTEIPELKTKCKTAKRSSSVEGTCSQSGCGPDFFVEPFRQGRLIPMPTAKKLVKHEMFLLGAGFNFETLNP